MLISLLLLGVLEYLWLNNEYKDAHRVMEDKLTQVMFSSMRDVEDSLIFTRLSAYPAINYEDSNSAHKFRFVFSMTDSVAGAEACPSDKLPDAKHFKASQRHQFRGRLLKELTAGLTSGDSTASTLSDLVMNRIRLADSTGDYKAYHLVSWQGSDTVLDVAMSIPQFDMVSDRKIALVNPHDRADIMESLIPHFCFAFFLWVMVAAAFYYIWRSLQKQIQLNALRDEFVSNITHELKTPITTASVALESLNMSAGMQNPQTHRYIHICQRELNRLGLLVERILNSNTTQVQFHQMNVKEVLEEVIDRMKVQFEDKMTKVHFETHGEGFSIHGDRTHMSGVFYNLFDNALKYGGDHPEIHVHLTRLEKTIELSIRDNGIGIAPDYHQKIFEKLYRVPQQDRHDVKGHGLGLSYVSDVVRQHHGKISLVSDLGKGSTFTMVFPASPEQDNEKNEASHSTEQDHTFISSTRLN